MTLTNCLRPVFLLLTVLLSATPVFASATEAPSGKTILSVSGQISETNDDGRFKFDMHMLEALPQHSFTTGTPWHPEKHEFSGPLLRDVLARVGADGDTLQAIALNDYKVEIPMEDTRDFDVIIARLMDGEPMSVRNKGPLFILYPFDQERETQSQIYYNRAIWQLKALHIE